LQQFKKYWAIYQLDIKDGFSHVYFPYALSKTYLNASRKWGWQWVFTFY